MSAIPSAERLSSSVRQSMIVSIQRRAISIFLSITKRYRRGSMRHATSAYYFHYRIFLSERLTLWNCPQFGIPIFCRLSHRIGYRSMQLETLKYLYDMEQACVLLSSFLVGKTFADYEADPMLRSAVERQLMIVGEALNRLRKIEPEVLATITNSREIIAFRNILVHGYDVIRNEVVWGILDSDLSTLTVDVSTLLQQG